MPFDPFFEEQVCRNNYGGQIETVVSELVADALKVAKDICLDTWKAAQAEIVPDNTETLNLLWASVRFIDSPGVVTFSKSDLLKRLNDKIAKLQA